MKNKWLNGRKAQRTLHLSRVSQIKMMTKKMMKRRRKRLSRIKKKKKRQKPRKNRKKERVMKNTTMKRRMTIMTKKGVMCRMLPAQNLLVRRTWRR